MCWLALAGRRLGFLLCQLVHRIQVILIGWGQNKAWLSSHRETERGRKGKQQLGSALCSPCVHNQAWVLVHCPWISMSAGSVWLGALSTDHCDCTVTRLATHLSASCHDLVWHVQVVVKLFYISVREPCNMSCQMSRPVTQWRSTPIISTPFSLPALYFPDRKLFNEMCFLFCFLSAVTEKCSYNTANSIQYIIYSIFCKAHL